MLIDALQASDVQGITLRLQICHKGHLYDWVEKAVYENLWMSDECL